MADFSRSFLRHLPGSRPSSSLLPYLFLFPFLWGVSECSFSGLSSPRSRAQAFFPERRLLFAELGIAESGSDNSGISPQAQLSAGNSFIRGQSPRDAHSRRELAEELILSNAGLSVTNLSSLSLQQKKVLPLLEFKANHFDFDNKLASWTLETADFVCVKKPLKKAWQGVHCDPAGNIVFVHVVNHHLIARPGVRNSIPASWGTQLPYLADVDLTCDNLAPFAGLVGSIPAELNMLTRLENLTLTGNALAGEIPDLSGTRLSNLILNDNFLNGTLKPWIGKLATLMQLIISLNTFSGNLPAYLSNCQRLSSADFHNNGFSGSIPPSWRNLQALSFLDVSYNSLSGSLPSWFASMPSLSIVSLLYNQFSGEIPKGWEAWKALSVLDVSYNQLSGEALGVFSQNCFQAGAFTQLISLTLAGNNFTGEILKELINCPYLSYVDLSSNFFHGRVPEVFGSLLILGSLSLRNNSLSGPYPADLALIMDTLAVVDLGENQLNGSLPDIRCNNSIQGFNLLLDHNQFSGHLPRSLAETCFEFVGGFDVSSNNFEGNLSTLAGIKPSTPSGIIRVNVSRNGFSGPLVFPSKPDAPLPSNMLLDYSYNNLSGPFPASVAREIQLEFLDISFNAISAPPSDAVLANLSLLLALNMSNNAMNGQLTSNWSGVPSLRFLNVSHNQLSGPIPGPSLSTLPLFSLDLSFNAFSGELSPYLANNSFLQQFSVSNNNLAGNLSLSFASLPVPYPRIQVLNFSRNSFSGFIPSGFANYSTSIAIDLSFNNFSGAIPAGNVSRFPTQFLAGNPGLCTNRSSNPGWEHMYPFCPERGSGISTGALVGIILGAVVIMALVLVCAYFAARPKDEWARGTFRVFQRLDFALSVRHIVEVTENFSDKYMLGRGGFGTVYKVTLPNGMIVAIKRLAAQSSQGDKEVQAEMDTLGNINHHNLVPLVAAFIAAPPSTERLLIYEFMPNGTLEDLLDKANEKGNPTRDWSFRKRVALDIAKGLKYLHSDCVPGIIHRDMKPANVLMDAEMTARVADFGLARHMDSTVSHKSTAAFGTVGYIAPEMVRLGRVCLKSDVYAYGIMVLQFVTGRLPNDPIFGETTLARWVRSLDPPQYVDPTISSSEKYFDEMRAMVYLGLLCLARVPAERPSMQDVVNILENFDEFVVRITAK